MDSLFFHPKIVHIPIALAVLMPLVSGGLLLAWWRKWLPWRAWIVAVVLQGILVGSGALAMETGEDAEEHVEHVVEKHLIHEHEEAAEAFVWAGGGVLVIMLAAFALARGKYGMSLAGTATLGTILLLGLGVRTGEAGGSLVYEHGAASAYVDAAPPTEGDPSGGEANERSGNAHDDHLDDDDD